MASSYKQTGFTTGSLAMIIAAGLILGSTLAYFVPSDDMPETVAQPLNQAVKNEQVDSGKSPYLSQTSQNNDQADSVAPVTKPARVQQDLARQTDLVKREVRQLKAARESSSDNTDYAPDTALPQNIVFSTDAVLPTGNAAQPGSSARSGSSTFTQPQFEPARVSEKNKSSVIDFFDNKPAATESIRGRVLLSNGSPAGGAVVFAQFLGAAQTGSRSDQQKSLTTNSAGAFELGGLLPGRYRLRASVDNEYSTDSLDVASGSVGVDLMLNRLTTVYVTGRVTDSQNQPIAGANAQLKSAAMTAVTNNDGVFTMTTRVERDSYYQFVVEKDGFATASFATPAAKLLSFGENALLDVRMKAIPGRIRITGAVRDIDGRSLAKQRVNFYSRTGGSYAASTDAYGNFAIDNVALASDYRLNVSTGSEYKRFSQRNIDLNQTDFFEIVRQSVTDFSTLAGRVVDTLGNPVPAFPLKINSLSGGNINTTVETDQAGAFQLQDVPAGKVYIHSSGMPDLMVANVSLPAGEIKTVEIPLDWGNQSLNGVVTTAAGGPLSGAKVQIYWSKKAAGHSGSRTLRTAYTDNNGQFAFSNLGNGTRSLTLSLSGYESVKQLVDLAARQPVQLLMERSW